jgi:excinuclease ABC subunit C
LNENVMRRLGGFKTDSEDFTLVNMPHNTNLVKLLQRIRDESHRFAVTYHSVLKRARQTSSHLDDVPGIGPATRKKLLREFGSLKGVKEASEADLAKMVGAAKAKAIKALLG